MFFFFSEQCTFVDEKSILTSNTQYDLYDNLKMKHFKNTIFKSRYDNNLFLACHLGSFKNKGVSIYPMIEVTQNKLMRGMLKTHQCLMFPPFQNNKNNIL